MATITHAQLLRLGACSDQRELFLATFGPSVEVTVELAVQYAPQFDFHWLAANTLKAPAQAEYDKAIAPAQAEYDKAKAAAQAEYDKVWAAAWAEYDKAIAPALAEYDKAIAPALAEYDKAIAPAWAAAYIKQCSTTLEENRP